ncbi:MAG: transposase [Desulfobacterales bacterium]|nr:MAG: transposase [Desulfobacterales bacterium]
MLARGNERKDIFYDDRERLRFLDVIGEMADTYDVDILAYVLMSNHFIFFYGSDQSICRIIFTRKFPNTVHWEKVLLRKRR